MYLIFWKKNWSIWKAPCVFAKNVKICIAIISYFCDFEAWNSCQSMKWSGTESYVILSKCYHRFRCVLWLLFNSFIISCDLPRSFRWDIKIYIFRLFGLLKHFESVVTCSWLLNLKFFPHEIYSITLELSEISFEES